MVIYLVASAVNNWLQTINILETKVKQYVNIDSVLSYYQIKNVEEEKEYEKK